MKKNALITGATGGIGLAIVEVLSKKFNLILVARNEKNLMKFHQKIIQFLNV